MTSRRPKKMSAAPRLFLLAALAGAGPLQAAPAWLIASDNENATAGRALRLEIAKPAAAAGWRARNREKTGQA